MPEIRDKDGWVELVDNEDQPRLRVGDAGVVQAWVSGAWTEVGAGAGGGQPLDSDLTAIAALTTTAYGRSVLEAASASALRTLAGLGTAAVAATGDFDAAGAAAAAQLASQPLDSDLTSIAALTTTSYGRALLALADAAALRTAGGLVIGTDIEAHDTDLTTFAGLSPTNDDIVQRKAGAWTNRTVAQFVADIASAGIPIAKLADPTTGKVIGSSGSAAAAVFPPGYEFDYVERTTALTVTPTTEGTAATWIDCNAVTYDGSTRIKIEAWADSVTATSGTAVAVLVDGSTAIGWLCEINGGAQVFSGARFLTPSAGAHTYHVKWWKTAGTIIVTAGAGGAGADMPAFVRQTKA